LAWRIFNARFADHLAAVICVSLTGLAYGLHPALTESVLWVACRFDLLMTFFLLFALLADRQFVDSSRLRASATGLLFLCALLSKETAVGFLLAIPFAHLAMEREPGQPLRMREIFGIWLRNRSVYFGLLVAFGLYMVLRFGILGSSLGLTKVLTRFDEIGSFTQRGIVIAASLTEYISDVLWPSFNVPPNRVLVIPVDSTDRILSAVAGSGGVALLAGVAVLRTSAVSVAGLFLCAFLAALLPLANIVPAPTYPGELQIAVRYVTFPMAFICLGVCALLPTFLVGMALRKPLWRYFTMTVAALWLAGSIVIIRTIVPLWHDEGVFFRWAIALAPSNSWPYLYINLGSHYANSKDMVQAREAFAKAVEAKPRSQGMASMAWYNLGNAEEKLGNLDQAQAVMRATLVVDPDNVFARASLSRIARIAGNARTAADIANEGLQRIQRAGMAHPGESMLHYQLGMAYMDLKRHDEAAKHFASAIAGARGPQARAEAEQALDVARKAGR
jgi:predicted negative regulator of RcsB-dependent stress response